MQENRCSSCPKSFKKPSQLARHLVTHTGVKSFECPTCSKKFSQKYSLETHLLVHSSVKPWACNKCSQTFRQKGNLKLHCKRVHLTDGKFKCKYCVCEFQKLASLNTHMSKVHSKASKQVPNVSEILRQIDELGESLEGAEEKPPEDPPPFSLGPKRPQEGPEKSDIDVSVRLPDGYREVMDSSGEKMFVKFLESAKKYLCNYCERLFRYPSDLFRHHRSHTGERPFVCQKEGCLKAFNIRWNMEQHMKIHQKEADFKNECLKEKNRRYLTEIENELKAETAKEVVCIVYEVIEEDAPMSPDEFQNIEIQGQHFVDLNTAPELPNIIVEHKNVVFPDSLRSCETCHKRFKKPVDLERHRRTHTGEKPFQCDFCGSRFSLKSTLEIHMRTHQATRPEFVCSVCSRSFSHQSSLNVHKRIHTESLNYKCSYCPKKFRTSGNRKKHHDVHLRIAKKEGKEPEETQTRVSKMDTLLLLESEEPEKQTRVNISIETQKGFLCSYCDKSFLKRSQIERHERVHTKVRPYQCLYCEKAFSQESILKTHQLTHSSERNFKCPCGTSYKFKSGLAYHKRKCSAGNGEEKT